MRARPRLARPLLAAAVAACFATPAWSQEDDIARLVLPESRVEAGVGRLHRAAPLFGLYNGLHEEGNVLLLDVDLVRRAESTGTWYRLTARNLGLDSRELRAEVNRQGHHGVFLEYSQVPRHEPYSVFTGLQGIGTDTLRVTGTGHREVELERRRRIGAIGFEKTLAPGLTAAVRLRTEDKQGDRLWGRGTPGAMEFIADPQDYQTRQVDATLAYVDPRLQLEGGYYGSSFDNAHPALHVLGGDARLALGANPLTPIANPPDNDAHQWHVAGGYNLARGTRLSFKYSRTRATQDDAFIVAPAAGIARDNLGGRVDGEQGHLGLSTRMLPALSLNASLRYEDRDDRTPVLPYFTGAGPTATNDGFNEPRSRRTTIGRLEGFYDGFDEWRLGARYEYDRRQRNTSAVRAVSHRDETEDHTLALEARRPLSETLSGSLSVERSERGGSEYLVTTLNNGTPDSNLVSRLLLADRVRHRVRGALDWSPREPVNLRLVVEEGRDDYSSSGTRVLGPQDGRARHLGLDASWAVTHAWRLTAFYGYDSTRAAQTQQDAPPARRLWRADLDMRGHGLGLGVRGRLARGIEAGLDLQRFAHRSVFRQESLAGVAIAQVPDIELTQSALKAHVRLPLDRDSSVRVLYVYDRWRMDDWTWRNFTYTDGTRLAQDARRSAIFLGVAYTRTFR